MRTTTSRTISTTAAVLLAAAALTATATTATAAAAPVHPTRFAVGTDGRVVLVDASSVAGYVANLAGFSNPSQWTATATFTVPTVTCTNRTTGTLFVQLFFNGTDKHGTTVGEGGYAIIGCNGLTPTYSFNISAQGGAPGGVDVPIAGGDTVTIDFAATRTVETSTVTDVTTGVSGSQTGDGFHADGGMQVSVQGGDAHSVFPRFGSVHFTKVLGGGRTLRALNPGSFDAQDAAGNVKIQTQPIDANGKGFVAKFVAEFTPAA